MQCGRHICPGAFTNNVKYMYSSVPGHTLDCTELIGGNILI